MLSDPAALLILTLGKLLVTSSAQRVSAPVEAEQRSTGAIIASTPLLMHVVTADVHSAGGFCTCASLKSCCSLIRVLLNSFYWWFNLVYQLEVNRQEKQRNIIRWTKWDQGRALSWQECVWPQCRCGQSTKFGKTLLRPSDWNHHLQKNKKTHLIVFSSES